jgi:hypothetical protein
VNRDEADRSITALGAAYDRVAGAMYTIDSDPALGFLRASGLAGKTAEIWIALRPEVDLLWTDFGAFGEAMEQVRTARAQRRPADSQWAEMERALIDRIPRLASTLTASGNAVAAILADVNRAWAAASAAIAPVADAMATLTRRAADLDDTADLAGLAQRVGLVADQLLADPLASAPRGVLMPSLRRDLANLSADIATASARIADQARIRDAYPERMDALIALIGTVAEAEDRVRSAFARAREKIVDAGLPPAPRAADILRARLSDMDVRRAERQWRRLADDIAMLEVTITNALARASELTEVADGLVARRDELRGRLDAYRAKAVRHLLDEHDTLGPLHAQARALLYSAPCDLHAATKAVYAYQRALTELVRPPEPRREPKSASAQESPRGEDISQ